MSRRLLDDFIESQDNCGSSIENKKTSSNQIGAIVLTPPDNLSQKEWETLKTSLNKASSKVLVLPEGTSTEIIFKQIN